MGEIWTNVKSALGIVPQGRDANRAEVKDSLNMIRSGDFSIDLDRRSASLLGQELVLTPDEFDLLVFLAGHRRSLITPRTVLASGWSDQGVRRTDLWRALLSLRGKLNAITGPGRQYLRTEPWVAYRFDTSLSTAG
jgi:DNA-binding response OmpR family regulator